MNDWMSMEHYWNDSGKGNSKYSPVAPLQQYGHILELEWYTKNVKVHINTLQRTGDADLRF